MRVLVRHGHFAFYPHTRDEVIHAQKLFKLELEAEDDYFTFPKLVGLPRWSQIGRPFGGLPALVTYEGRHASDVMRENGFVYSLATDLLMPFVGSTDIVRLPQGPFAALAPKPLIQPGSLLQGGLGVPGNVLLGYEGELDLQRQRLYVYAQETLL